MISQTSEIDSLLPVSVRLPSGYMHACVANALILQRSNLKPTQQVRRLRRPNLQKKEWAHVIDVNTPFNNFHELVPDMAHKVINQLCGLKVPC